MYVVKLDRPWLSTPFDPQGFPISSPAQVKLLARYCKAVHIDTGRATKRGGLKGKMKGVISVARMKAAVREAGRGRSRRRSASRAR